MTKGHKSTIIVVCYRSQISFRCNIFKYGTSKGVASDLTPVTANGISSHVSYLNFEYMEVQIISESYSALTGKIFSK